jgi:RES domain-containing protein
MTEIKAYRLVKRRFSSSAFDGEGARRFGGQWNSKGQRCVYVADSPALAVLEVLVHVTRDEILKAYELIEITFPQELALRTAPESLPWNWRMRPAPQDTADFGDAWLESGESLALAVPSIIVPMSWNYLLNNDHPEFEVMANTAKTIPLEFVGRFK